MVAENGLIFREEQRFAGWFRWLFALVIVLVLFLLWYSEKKEGQSLPGIAVVIAIIVPATLAVLFWVAKLETQVRSDGLYVRLFPFHINFKKFAFEDFGQYYSQQYSPILEYGGWGIRYGFKSGKAFNVRGNKGLQIIFKNGKKLLIGSQKPAELVAAIDSIVKPQPL